MPIKNNNFSSDFRLKSSKDISKTFANGSFLYKGAVSFLLLDNKSTQSRLAVCLKKKFGNAPQRNHIKRMAREIFRQDKELKFKGYDIVLLCTKRHKEFKYENLKKIFSELKTSIK